MLRRVRAEYGLSMVDTLFFMASMVILFLVITAMVRRSSRLARESEAVINISKLSDSLRSYFMRSLSLPEAAKRKQKQRFFPSSQGSQQKQGSFAVMPAESLCNTGRARYEANAQRWLQKTEPWVHLSFSIAKGHFYQYGYTSSQSCPQSNVYRGYPCFILQAQADLDCDGTPSALVLLGGFSPAESDVTRQSLLYLRRGE
ncbi:MAG: hypothetical protein AAGJ35_02390 [Myxococcota bacterium]